MTDKEKNMKEIGRMFIRDDEVIDENIDLTEYFNDYANAFKQKNNTEIQKYNKDYDLLECCKDYLDNPTQENFDKFQQSLETCSVMAAPVAYQFVSKYKTKSEYRNQCIILQEILMKYINENNIISKSI